jgi:hypothetical protein
MTNQATMTISGMRTRAAFRNTRSTTGAPATAASRKRAWAARMTGVVAALIAALEAAGSLMQLSPVLEATRQLGLWGGIYLRERGLLGLLALGRRRG